MLGLLADVNGKKRETKEYLKAGFMFEEEKKRAEQQQKNQQLTNSKKKSLTVRKYGIMDLFRYKSTRVTTICLCLIYFGIYMQYFGAIFALQSLGGNKYINATILNCTELGAYVLAVPVVDKLRRRLSFPGTHHLSCKVSSSS